MLSLRLALSFNTLRKPITVPITKTTISVPSTLSATVKIVSIFLKFIFNFIQKYSGKVTPNIIYPEPPIIKLKYLDLYGGHGVISVGHSHPKYVTAIKEQVEKIGFYSNSIQNSLL